MPENKVEIKFGANTGELQSAMQQVQSIVSGALGTIKGNFSDLAQASTAAGNSMSQSVEQTRGKISGLSTAFGELKTHLEALATLGAAKNILQTGIAVDNLGRVFHAITGSTEGAKSEMGFLRYESNRLGLEFMSTATAYKTVADAARGTRLEGQGVRDIFIGLAEKATVLHLDSETLKGVLWAVGQMMSKNSVQAEELKGQLGERLPGAVRLFAQAMGVSVAELEKLMQKGELLADEVLPKLGKGLHEENAGSVGDAANSATAAINRLQNTLTDLKTSIADTTNLDGFRDAVNGISSAIKVMTAGVITCITALRALGLAFAGVGASAKVFFESIKFGSITDAAKGVADGVKQVLDADTVFKGWSEGGGEKIKNALGGIVSINRNVGEQIKGIWDDKGVWGDILKSFQDASSKIYDLLYKEIPAPPPPVVSGGPKAREAPVDADKLIKKLKDQVQEERDQYILSGRTKDWTHEKEVTFWRSQLATVKEGTEAYKAVQHELAASMEKAAKEGHKKGGGLSDSGQFKQALEEEVEEARAAGVDTKRYELQKWNDRLTTLKKGSREYLEALREVNRLAREIAREDAAEQERKARQEEAVQRVRAQSALEHEEAMYGMRLAALDHQVEMGAMSQKEALRIEKQYLDERYQAQLADLQRRLILMKQDPGMDPAKLEAIYAQMRSVTDKYWQDSQRIANQGAIQTKTAWDSVSSQISGNLGNALNSMLSRTQSATQTMKSLWNTMAANMINAVLRMTTQFIVGETTKTAAAGAAATTREGIQQVSEEKGLATQAAGGLKSIMNDAYKAAAGAYSALAGIPIVGPVLGAAAAVVTFAAVAAFGGSLVSAAGGWGDVPKDQLAMVHKREMILPAQIAETVRAVTNPAALMRESLATALAGIGSWGIPAEKLAFFNGVSQGSGYVAAQMPAGSAAGAMMMTKNSSSDNSSRMSVYKPTFNFPADLAGAVKRNPDALYKGVQHAMRHGHIRKKR